MKIWLWGCTRAVWESWNIDYPKLFKTSNNSDTVKFLFMLSSYINVVAKFFPKLKYIQRSWVMLEILQYLQQFLWDTNLIMCLRLYLFILSLFFFLILPATLVYDTLKSPCLLNRKITLGLVCSSHIFVLYLVLEVDGCFSFQASQQMNCSCECQWCSSQIPP